jgi:hypothetical protein
MRTQQHGLARVFAAGVCLAALAACSSSNSTGTKTGSGTLPSQAVQQEVAASVASSIASEISAITTTSYSSFIGLYYRVEPFGKRVTPSLAKLFARNGGAHAFEATDCPAITGSLTSSAGDGIPDNVTETWGSDCIFADGSDTTSITGSIQIQAATPNTPGLGYTSSINNLDLTEAGPSLDATIGINGTLAVTETLSSITVAANYTYNFAETAPNAVTEAVVEKLNSTYSFPATSTLLVEGDVIPPGTFNISGSETFTVNNTTYAFTVQTPTPLTVDVTSCPTGVTSGVVTVGFSGQGATGTATITWTGCGAYTISDN